MGSATRRPTRQWGFRYTCGSCQTICILCHTLVRSLAGREDISRPRNRTRPEVGLWMPMTQRARVLFPAPALAHQAEEIALGQFQGDPVQGGLVPGPAVAGKTLDQVPDDQHTALRQAQHSGWP